MEDREDEVGEHREGEGWGRVRMGRGEDRDWGGGRTGRMENREDEERGGWRGGGQGGRGGGWGGWGWGEDVKGAGQEVWEYRAETV